LLENGLEVILPEIVDYEVRRELLRARKTEGITRLNWLKDTLQYAPLTTEVMLRAAELWALARQQGKPTAKDDSLDGDVILAAQALALAEDPDDVVVATTNPAHLARFVPAREWSQI
jgi:predicted nucleic acid-binding protein